MQVKIYVARLTDSVYRVTTRCWPEGEVKLFTARTGHGARRNMDSATLPLSMWEIPRRPCVPMTRRSQADARTHSRIESAGTPPRTTSRTETPADCIALANALSCEVIRLSGRPSSVACRSMKSLP